jgi:transposase
VNARQIINYIPDELLQGLCIKYNVNHQVKKLDGRSMFQLLLYSFLTTRETSYRVIEEVYHSIAFAKVANSVHQGVKFNSIRDRLTAINADYFESIFSYCLNRFEADLGSSSNIVSFDSTLVTASSKLLKSGMKINKKGDKRYVKFTMGFRKVPVHAAFFSDQNHVSEDLALSEAILAYSTKEDDIIVFDRGLQSRKVLEQLNVSNYQFVTRVNPNIRFVIIEEYPLSASENEESQLTIKHDYCVRIFDKKKQAHKRFLKANNHLER